MLNFMLIDDDDAIRFMLEDIIIDYDLGNVVSSMSSAKYLINDSCFLQRNDVDILIIDMLMPEVDGIEAVSHISKYFQGQIIMLSQIEDKQLIGKAYENGVNYYITKPINRNEVIGVIRSVSEHIQLKKVVHNLNNTINAVLQPQKNIMPKNNNNLESVLHELGIASMTEIKDFTDIMSYIKKQSATDGFPNLKSIFAGIAQERHADNQQKEIKALEQRIRRSVFSAMNSVASMGIVDYTNPKFEEFASWYFDYSDICHIMTIIKKGDKTKTSNVRINIKKFLQALYTTINK